MMSYRYLVAVDGYAASWDGNFWKLSSGSTVMYLQPNGYPSQAWSQWYHPLLKASKVAVSGSCLLLLIQTCFPSRPVSIIFQQALENLATRWNGATKTNMHAALLDRKQGS